MRIVQALVLDEVDGPVYFLPSACGWARVQLVEPVQPPLSTVLDKLAKHGVLDED